MYHVEIFKQSSCALHCSTPTYHTMCCHYIHTVTLVTYIELHTSKIRLALFESDESQGLSTGGMLVNFVSNKLASSSDS